MISPEQLFGNLFHEVRITDLRLVNTGFDTINRLTAANGNPQTLGPAGPVYQYY